MASVLARRPTLLTAPEVVDFAASPAAFSPLDQVGLSVHNDPATDSAAQKPEVAAEPAPIPTLDFNLFRSPSVYSVDSNLDSSYSDYAGEEYGFGFVSEPEEGLDSDSTEDGGRTYEPPSSLLSNIVQLHNTRTVSSSIVTRKASRTASGDIAVTTPSDSGTTTPTCEVPVSRNGSVRARGPISYPSLPQIPFSRTVRSAISDAPFNLQPVPVLRTGRSLSGPPEPESTLTARIASQRSCSDPVPQPQPAPIAACPQRTSVIDAASIHGEQGSDWGEDENTFEWLDSAGTKEASNGVNRKRSLLRLSPRRLTRLRSVVGVGSPEIEQSPTSPAPPAVVSVTASVITPGQAPSQKKKKRPIVIPRRAAPPPPTDAPSFVSPTVLAARSGVSPRSALRRVPTESENVAPDFSKPPVVVIAPTPPRKGAEAASSRTAPFTSLSNEKVNDATGDYFGRFSNPKVPARSVSIDAAASPSSSQGHSFTRPLDGEVIAPSPEFARRGSAGSSSANEQWESEERRRRMNTTRRPSGARSTSPQSPASEASSTVSMNVEGKTPASIVAAGLARRQAGDLPKSAWLFMKAAEAGSTTGRIHYGLALRHGLGVARDDRKAFSELLLACDRSLAEGGVDLRATAGSMILTSQQRLSMAPDTSLALVEVGNCYLEGLGVKRNPDLAIEYLRMGGSLGDMAAMEQLGYILSKGVNGVKKDQREAAKWYRAAITAGSTIPGLGWVWKDKYNP